VDLDATLATYLPGVARWASAVTVRQMMHHQSGIPDYIDLRRAAQQQAEEMCWSVLRFMLGDCDVHGHCDDESGCSATERRRVLWPSAATIDRAGRGLIRGPRRAA
jgi:Beta-lactamase